MDKVEKKQIRILHIVGGMDAGGVETWLMHVLRRIDRNHYKFDFLVHADRPCFYDDEIRSLGCRIIPCLHPSHPWQFAKNFLRILKDSGSYDVVHSHVHHFSGFTLLLARLAGVPMRIAHSHTDLSASDDSVRLFRKLYFLCARQFIRLFASVGLACSHRAADNLFGNDWQKDSRWRLLYCGIDMEPFRQTVDRNLVRRELGVSQNAFVVGHVGRFSEPKNHDFLLDIFAAVVDLKPNASLLLVGDGPLREKLEQKTQQLGLSEKVVFAGVRSDIARLMLGSMDVFVFPSHHEGLGLALIEAQSAGVPVLMSDVVPEEAIIVSSLVKRLSLMDDVETWAQAALNSASSRQPCAMVRQCVSNSKFNITLSLEALCKVYLSGGDA